jgi:hypothetical protein
MRQGRRWGRALAAALLLVAALSSRAARADGSAAPPAGDDRVIKIGPQAVVIVNQHGDVRMYDDPAEQARACRSKGACWGGALGILSTFFVLTYEDLTEGVEGGRALQGGQGP